MMEPSPIVFVVDDDSSVRKALRRLIRSAGWRVETFDSARAFLDHGRPDGPSCLVLDVQMPGLDGLELQRSLNTDRTRLPIVFITGHGDIPMSVRAMKAGAMDFLSKPFSDESLLNAIEQALARDQQDRQERSDVAAMQQREESLTPREREVMALVVSGLMNKQIGTRLGVTVKTVKVHRGQVMRKMRARSLAELVRMAQKVGIATSR